MLYSLKNLKSFKRPKEQSSIVAFAHTSQIPTSFSQKRQGPQSRKDIKLASDVSFKDEASRACG